MEKTMEAEYLDTVTRECIEYAIDFGCDLEQALDDFASELSSTGFPLTERQVNLVRERLKYVEL